MAQTRSKPLTRRGRYWLKHVQQWQASKNTQVQYCKDQGISLCAFRWWRRRLNGNTQSTPPAKATFTEVPMGMLQMSATGYAYEVTLPNRTQLRLQRHFDPKAVASLLALLEHTC